MNISELSIRRPVLATVLTVIILLFGMIGYTTLGVREYPSVDNPIISVTCSYSGANADVIENQITEPLEQNINGIPGIRSLSSVSQQGQCRITVEFELSVDLETAANDVRDKVSRAQRYLPRDCDPPTVSKADADASPILMVAIQSNSRSLLELSEIADLTVKEQLQTISDVSSVSIWGEKRYSMRLWLDPVKMAGYGITPVDVKNAINDQNLRPDYPSERYRLCRIGCCRPEELHEDERRADGGCRSHPSTGSKPHRDSRCRIRTYGTDAERLTGRRRLQLRIR